MQDALKILSRRYLDGMLTEAELFQQMMNLIYTMGMTKEDARWMCNQIVRPYEKMGF